MSLVKDETSKIKQKHGLIEFYSFLFPSSLIRSLNLFWSELEYQNDQSLSNSYIQVDGQTLLIV